MRRTAGQTAARAAGAVTSLQWSRYCPECGVRYRMTDVICREDGAALRDLSVSATWPVGETTGMPPVSALICRLCGQEIESENHTCAGGGHSVDGTDHPLVGRTLGGRWRIEKWIGRGGFGDFFRGRHEILDMPVGIKVLRPAHTRTEDERRRFFREALRVSRLDHPNVVKVFDYGEDDDRPFLVMEYLSGRSLARHLRGDGLSLRDGVEVVRQVGVALIEAHGGAQTGGPLVHLDLKPEHFFLEPVRGGWNVKVIDFGLAEIAAGTEEGTEESFCLAGTLPYMAPERWRSVIDPRADLYSLGVVLYELIAGRLPFHAEDPVVMRRLHEEETPTPPSRHRSAQREPMMADLDALVLRALEKDPKARPQTAEQLVNALELWQERVGWSRWRRAWRTGRRTWRKTRAALGWMAAAVIAFVALSPAMRPKIVVEEQSPIRISPNKDLRVRVATPLNEVEAHLVLWVGSEKERLQGTLGNEPFHIAWDDLKLLARREEEVRGTAHIETSGVFGGTSDEFDVILDWRLPVIGPADREPEVKHDGDTMYVAAPAVKLVADATVTWVVDGSNRGESETHAVRRPAESHAPSTVRVTDEAGNTSTLRIHWIKLQVKGLSADGALYTQRPEVDVTVIGPGVPTVRLGDSGPLDPIDIGGTKYSLRDATPNDGSPGKVHIEVRSPICTATDRPLIRQSIDVRVLNRTLRVEPVKAPEGTAQRPVYTIVDASNTAVPLEGINIEGFELVAGRWDPRGVARRDGAIEVTAWGGGPVKLEGRDAYGNEIRSKTHVPKGLVVEVEVEPETPGSSYEYPMHSPACGCADWRNETASMLVRVGSDAWGLEGEMVVKHNGKVLTNMRALAQAERFDLNVAADLGLRTSGKHQITLTVEDAYGNRGQGSCPVYLAGECGLSHKPDSGVQVDRNFTMHLTTDCVDATGVGIDGEPATRSDGAWVWDVTLEEDRMWTAEVSVNRRGGCKDCKPLTVKYWMPPVAGKPYVFCLGSDLETVEFRLLGADPPMWYTGVDVGAELARQPDTGSPDSSRDSAEWAAHLAARVTQTLRDRGILSELDSVRLPSHAELLRIRGEGPPSPSDVRSEWLRNEKPPDGVAEDSDVKYWSTDGKVRKAHPSESGAGFRLVLSSDDPLRARSLVELVWQKRLEVGAR